MIREEDYCVNDTDGKPCAKTMPGLVRMLRREGAKHGSLYHYTRWDSFSKMMQPVEQGVCAGHRMIHLSRADKMNDKIEKGWGKSVFMTCFSYSKYEDVAMWMNYGKRSPDAVRVRIDGGAVAEWCREHRNSKHDIFIVKEDERGDCSYEPLGADCVASIELADVAYVIHHKLMTGRHWGNVEFSRRFYRVEDTKTGFDWSDNIYDGEPRKENPGLPAYFKKRGWGYERETRLIITLKEGVECPHRLAVFFDAPFATLSAVSCNERPRRHDCDEECEEMRARHSVMRGPWFDKDSATDVLAGKIRISDIDFDSDYASEIEIISADRMSVRELVVQADKRLHELAGRGRGIVKSDDKRFLRALGDNLRCAARSINAHIDRCDFKPNLYKLASLEIVDPLRVAELSLIDRWAESYLKVLREIARSEKGGWRVRIPFVSKYGEST